MHRRIWKIPLPLLAVLVASGVVAAVLLGPLSTPAPTAFGKITLSISGVSAQLNWGDQYYPQNFTTVVTANSYTTTKAGVVPIIVVDKTCAALTTAGFVLKVNKTSAASYETVTGMNADGLSKGPTVWGAGYCAYIPGAAKHGKSIAAGITGDTWYFQYTFGSGDVSTTTYTFVAQAYAP